MYIVCERLETSMVPEIRSNQVRRRPVTSARTTMITGTIPRVATAATAMRPARPGGQARTVAAARDPVQPHAHDGPAGSDAHHGLQHDERRENEPRARQLSH